MDLETIDDEGVIRFPIATVSQFSRKCSIGKEKVLLIVLSSILIAISSLSSSLFIVHTIVEPPTFSHVKTTATVVT